MFGVLTLRYLNLVKNISNWQLYLAVKFGLTAGDPLGFVARRGIRLEVPRRLVQTFKEIFMDECYMAGMGQAVPEKPTILDIGANAGYFSLFALSRFPDARVVAFEPLPANFRLLERQRAMNSDRDFTCVQKAVSGERGTLTLAYDAKDSFSTSATLFAASSGQLDEITVETLTLRDIWTDFGIERCDLLKMDCEGAEYGILYVSSPDDLARISQIAMEVHRGPKEDENIDALETFLRKMGFKTRRRPVGMLWAWREGR
jgi:FkbM family methyltransferase